jgi:hypothetical protein
VHILSSGVLGVNKERTVTADAMPDGPADPDVPSLVFVPVLSTFEFRTPLYGIFEIEYFRTLLERYGHVRPCVRR